MISEKFSTNTESFNEFRRGRRIDWRFPVEVSIYDYGANILNCCRKNNIEPIKCYNYRLNRFLSFALTNEDIDNNDEEELLSTLMNTIE